MLFTMRKIIVTIEAGVGTRTVPMLLMESSFQAELRDWSSNVSCFIFKIVLIQIKRDLCFLFLR